MSKASAEIHLLGRVERVVFHNPDTGFCVLKVKVNGRRRIVTVVGHSHSVAPGENLEVSGEWTEHEEHGERFVASSLKTTFPSSVSAVEKFLGSGLIRGVGPHLAKKMVEKFGASVFEVIELSPEKLRAVEGLGKNRIDAIVSSWREQKSLRGIMDFLNTHGLSTNRAPKILKAFGAEAVQVLEKNPYRLAQEVDGIGFRAADMIAKISGLKEDSLERFASALHDRLQVAVSRGHCALPTEQLLKESASLVGFLPGDLSTALDQEIAVGRLREEEIEEKDARLFVFPEPLAFAEERLAKNLVSLAKGALPWKSLPRASGLSHSQTSALRRLQTSKVSVLTGGPGTGKTTLIREVVKALQGYRVSCCAPTGRAAQRLMEAAGVEAQTIHRLLGWDVTNQVFKHREDNPLEVDLLIVDEASMVGVELMDALIAALPLSSAVLIVGDRDQLPSIQAGRVLESIIESDAFTHAHLEEVFRQANGDESLIVRVAREIIHGRTPDLVSHRPLQEFHFIEVRSADRCINRIVTLVKERIPASFALDPIRDIQVLAPMNKGEAGAKTLNRELQLALNPFERESVERFGQRLSVGDKVIVTANDYDKDVFNGDIGRISLIDHDRKLVRVDLGSVGGFGRQVDFDFAELDSLALAFATSVHKAQGSEYDAVVIPVMEESAALLSRQLLYTAVTRAKKLVVLVGTREGLRLALRETRERRYSALSMRIKKFKGGVSAKQKRPASELEAQ